jgi:hypothetical protein
MVLRDTHVQYETLLDICNALPEGFAAQLGVNNHSFSVLFLLTSDVARSAIDGPVSIRVRDGRQALMAHFAHLAPVTEREVQDMLRAVQDFIIKTDSPPMPQMQQLVLLRDQLSLATNVTYEEIDFICNFRLSLSYDYNNPHVFLQSECPETDLQGLHRRAHEEYELIVDRRETSGAHAFTAINPLDREWRGGGPAPGRNRPYVHPDAGGRGDGRRRGLEATVCHLCAHTGHVASQYPPLAVAK